MASRARTFALFVPIVIVLVIVDRLTKGWAVDNLRMSTSGPDLGLVDLTLVHNQGAAFGMGQGSGLVFVAIALAICIVAVVWLAVSRRHNALEVTALALIVAGGLGNLADRLATGYVVDFIRFTFVDFPVFNVADICVTCGVVLFLVAVIFTDVFAGARDDACAGDAEGIAAGDADDACAGDAFQASRGPRETRPLQETDAGVTKGQRR